MARLEARREIAVVKGAKIVFDLSHLTFNLVIFPEKSVKELFWSSLNA